jgi:TonB family protein
MLAHVLAFWVVAQAVQSTTSSPAHPSACSEIASTGLSGAAAEICLAEQALKQGESEASPNQRQRLLQAAVQHYRRAATLGTTSEVKSRALEGLERVYDAKHLNQPAEAEQVLWELIALQPTDLTAAVFRLAKLQEDRGLLDAAEDTLLSARQQHPTQIDPYRMLAQFYARRATALHQLSESRKPTPSSPGERDEQGVYRVGGGVEPPKRLDVPQYPIEAQAAGIQGVVLVEVVINETGIVTDAKVARSIPMLDEAALRAVRQWKFDPTIVSGQPVPVRMTVTVNFTLPRR